MKLKSVKINTESAEVIDNNAQQISELKENFIRKKYNLMHLIGYKAYINKYPEDVNTPEDIKIDGYIVKLRDKIDESREKSDELNTHKKQISELELQIEMLKNDKNDRMREEEKKKAEEIMNLNVNMKEKIELLKQQYTESNNDRISAITQLTMLQNSQLTNELEYQSSKADKALTKNTNLQDNIYNCQRDIDIHKEVENKLAKNAKDLYKK